MSKAEDKRWLAHAERIAEAQRRAGDELHRTMAAETREKVARIAGHFVDILAGRADDAHLNPDPSDPAYARAPAGIPTLAWSKPGLPAGSYVQCNSGEYVADKYRTETQTHSSVAFNAGFLAALLAVREGLIDPGQFDPMPTEVPVTPTDIVTTE